MGGVPGGGLQWVPQGCAVWVTPAWGEPGGAAAGPQTGKAKAPGSSPEFLGVLPLALHPDSPGGGGSDAGLMLNPLWGAAGGAGGRWGGGP